MTPTNDEVLASLRASLQATAARTPIGAERLAELALVTTEERRGAGRPLVATMSAAAAVAAIAAVTAVVSSANSSGPRTGSPATGSAPSQRPSVTNNPSTGACTPENYYVIASKEQLAGLTYMLPSVPEGYHLYGAWGTISRNNCLSSATFYVEYDSNTPDNGNNNIDITVHRTGPGSSYPMPMPSDRSDAPEAQVTVTQVTVDGHPASFLDLNGKGVGLVQWTADDAAVQVVGPLAGGSSAAFLALAGSVVPLPADDPRIQAPANCRVPAGNVCSSSIDAPEQTPSDTQSDNPATWISATPSPSPSPTSAVASMAPASPSAG